MTTHALRLTSPGELIAAVPFLLGFQPQRSVVLMALQQRRIGLTERLDLPDPGQELAAAAAMLRPLLRDQADSALLIDKSAAYSALVRMWPFAITVSARNGASSSHA